MYDSTYWKDHVVDQSGTIIQQGTNLSAQNFNNMEHGISDSHVTAQILMQHQQQREWQVDDELTAINGEIEVETGSIKLSNTDTYPFNNSAATVALKKTRNLHYTVEAVVKSYEGGLPGNFRIFDKAINGFKIAFDGSAKSVTLDYIVKGGFLS
jgi:hypothetical protein